MKKTKFHFKIEGEFLTKLVRDMWESLLPYNAFECLESPDQIPYEIALDICTGKRKLSSTNNSPELKIVDDNQYGKYFSLEKVISLLEEKWLEKMFLLSKIKYDTIRQNKLSFDKTEIEIHNIKTNIKSICQNLQIVYKFINKDLSDLPYEKLSSVFSETDYKLFDDIYAIKKQVQNLAEGNLVAYLPCVKKDDLSLEVNLPKKYEDKKIKIKKLKAIPEFKHDAWISPNGDVYVCDYGEHETLAYEITKHSKEPELLLEKKGWLKLSNKKFYYINKLTKKQKDIIIDYMIKNSFNQIEINYFKINLNEVMDLT